MFVVVLSAAFSEIASWWRSEIDFLAPPASHKSNAKDAFIGSPSILQTDETNGYWLASHDRFFDEKEGTAYILSAQGSSIQDLTDWTHTTSVSPMYWAQLFMDTHNATYIIGTSGDITSTGDIVISRCLNKPCTGTNWTEPMVLFAGSSEHHYHAAPTPVVPSTDGKFLYRAFDMIIGTGDMQVVLLSGQTSCADLTVLSCWALSEGITFDPKWMPVNGSAVAKPDRSNLEGAEKVARQWEEPGVIVDAKTGSVHVMVRLDAPLSNCQTLRQCNQAALLSFEAPGTLHFEKIVQFPSSCNKFAVRQDPSSGYFYSLTNPVVRVPTAACGQRNQVVLTRSSDLHTWRSCAVVLWDDTGKSVPDSIALTGLQYIDWRFHASTGDIAAAVRAGYNGSTTYHDASRLLLTNVRGYAALCEGVYVRGDDFALGVLLSGQQSFSNRDYVWRSVPAPLQGLMFTRKSGGEAATISLMLPSYLLSDSAALGVAPTIYVGVCASQAGHNASAFEHDFESTNLSFTYSSKDDEKVSVLQMKAPTLQMLQQEWQIDQPHASVGIPVDGTWCGSIAIYRAGSETNGGTHTG